MMVLFDASSQPRQLTTGTEWRVVTDQVMGGRSSARIRPDEIDGQACLRLCANISLANNGGFAQMAVDVAEGESADWSSYASLALHVVGNGELYSVHLRTTQLSAPWQSYRAHFTGTRGWSRVELSLDEFRPHRTNHLLDPRCIRRLGIVAIGREFDADVAIGRIELVPRIEE